MARKYHEKGTPRRYLFHGVCDECGDPFEDYRPRPSVRRKISPFVFCCPAHKNRHWRRRKAAKRLVEAQPYPCAGPGDDGRGCPNLIEPRSGPGGPQLYCDRTCRTAAAAARRRRRPGAKSAAYLLARFEISAGDYTDAKQERQGLMRNYGETTDQQEAFFEKNGGRAGVLTMFQEGLDQVYAKHGGHSRFAVHLPAAARGKAEQERNTWRDAITRLRRVLELEVKGGDTARFRRQEQARAAWEKKCRHLERDAANARARRARKQGADLLMGHDPIAAAPTGTTGYDGVSAALETAPDVDLNDVPGPDAPAGEDGGLEQARGLAAVGGGASPREDLRDRAAVDPEYRRWARARGLL